MMRFAPFLIFIFLIYASVIAVESSGSSQETVILLHGLCRSAKSMTKLNNSLENAGYIVVAESYPSTRQDIRKHAE